MLRKILFAQAGKGAFLITTLGLITGFTLLLSTVKVYRDVSKVYNDSKELLKGDYLVINKPVSGLNTIGFGETGFSEEELEACRKQKTVVKAAPFTANQFKAVIEANAGFLSAGMVSELFFESVPDDFVDLDSTSWKWQPGELVIPMVIPADYINLYNFGFAPGRGLPQISENLLKSARFELILSGNGQKQRFTARIAGFSDRINSILLPTPFMEFANKNFGSGKKSSPQRIIAEVDDPTDKDFLHWLNENGYDTNNEQLRSGKLSMLIRIIAGLFGSIGIIIIGLAFLGFVQQIQLLLTKSKRELIQLARLGYPHKKIINAYSITFISMLSISALAGIGITWFILSSLSSTLESNGFPALIPMDFNTLLLGGSTWLLLVSIVRIWLSIDIKRIASFKE